jgi:hypothetical protein
MRKADADAFSLSKVGTFFVDFFRRLLVTHLLRRIAVDYAAPE